MTRASQVAQRSEATRSALVRSARRLFVEKGYYSTGTEEIVEEAGVGTRGALYHHFSDKQALFLAVFEAVEEDLVSAAGAPTLEGGAVERLRSGLLGFLEAAATSREVQQVLLIDGPAVLGWQRWRSLEERYGLGAIRGLLAEAVAEGVISPQPLDALAHILLAAVDEAALYVANAADRSEARGEAADAMGRVLAGLTR
jgi:AcrR family transcriptional regulator